MQKPLIVITPEGPIEANYMTNRLTLTIMGREFWSTPIVLEESSIDLILGMPWLRKEKAVIHCARGTVELTSTKGERFKVMITITASTRPAVYLVDGKFVGRNIRVVRDFPDVFPEELPGMPLDKGKLSLLLISYLELSYFKKVVHDVSRRTKKLKKNEVTRGGVHSS
jgi:hypothetical protein